MFAPRFEQGSLFKILDETHGLVYEREGGTQARGGSEGGHSCEFRWSKPCSGVVLVALARAPNPFSVSHAPRQCAVHPIVLVSVSAEDRAIDHQNRPRRSSTRALDVLSPRRSSDPSVHVAMRMVAFSRAAQLHSADQCRHGITWHLLGCCTCTRCTSCCPKICALRAR